MGSVAGLLESLSSYLRLLSPSPSKDTIPSTAAALSFLLADRVLLLLLLLLPDGWWSSLSTSQYRRLLLFSSPIVAGNCYKCSSPLPPSIVVVAAEKRWTRAGDLEAARSPQARRHLPGPSSSSSHLFLPALLLSTTSTSPTWSCP